MYKKLNFVTVFCNSFKIIISFDVTSLHLNVPIKKSNDVIPKMAEPTSINLSIEEKEDYLLSIKTFA